MLKQLHHKRFTIQNDQLSLPGCYWYVQAQRNIEPTGNVNDRIHQRPDYVYT